MLHRFTPSILTFTGSEFIQYMPCKYFQENTSVNYTFRVTYDEKVIKRLSSPSVWAKSVDYTFKKIIIAILKGSSKS